MRGIAFVMKTSAAMALLLQVVGGSIAFAETMVVQDTSGCLSWVQYRGRCAVDPEDMSGEKLHCKKREMEEPQAYCVDGVNSFERKHPTEPCSTACDGREVGDSCICGSHYRNSTPAYCEADSCKIGIKDEPQPEDATLPEDELLFELEELLLQ